MDLLFWGFVGGVLLYSLVGVLAGFQWVFATITRRPFECVQMGCSKKNGHKRDCSQAPPRLPLV